MCDTKEGFSFFLETGSGEKRTACGNYILLQTRNYLINELIMIFLLINKHILNNIIAYHMPIQNSLAHLVQLVIISIHSRNLGFYVIIQHPS